MIPFWMIKYSVRCDFQVLKSNKIRINVWCNVDGLSWVIFVLHLSNNKYLSALPRKISFEKSLNQPKTIDEWNNPFSGNIILIFSLKLNKRSADEKKRRNKKHSLRNTILKSAVLGKWMHGNGWICEKSLEKKLYGFYWIFDWIVVIHTHSTYGCNTLPIDKTQFHPAE